jgi:hypothetical protein
MRSRRASAPGPADGCFLSVRRGARDLIRVDVPKLRGLGTCVLMPEKSSAGQEPGKPKSTALRVKARITPRPSCQQSAKGAS